MSKSAQNIELPPVWQIKTCYTFSFGYCVVLEQWTGVPEQKQYPPQSCVWKLFVKALEACSAQVLMTVCVQSLDVVLLWSHTYPQFVVQPCPARPVLVWLRLMQGLWKTRPPPCINDGDLSSLVHHRNIVGW